MNEQLGPFSEAFYRFIKDHLADDPVKLLLKYGDASYGFDIRNAIMQISCRRKTSDKLEPFLKEERFLFPDSLSAEQASDWRIAEFHSSLIGTGKKVLDLTAGLGIDALTIARSGNMVTAIELDTKKAEYLVHNSRVMDIHDMKVINGDSETIVSNLKDHPSIVFIDPARRNIHGRRVHAFDDCTPDITSFYRGLLDNGCEILIKSSPMLDMTAVMNSFDRIDRIYAVSVKGVCKELLVHLVPADMNCRNELVALDLDDKGHAGREFIMSRQSKSGPHIFSGSIPTQGYIYEPVSSLMKLPAYGEICIRYDLEKLSVNTELYYSKELRKQFPGRIFQIENIVSKGEFKTVSGSRANVITRNYTEDAESLRKKLGLRQGVGITYIGCKLGIPSHPVLFKTVQIS